MRLTVLFAILLAGAPLAFGGAAEGKDLFAKRCKACHGPEGQGNPGMAKMLKVTFVHLGSKEVQSKSDADLKKIITEGTGKMKPVTGLSAAQVSDVIAFVRTLKP
ncbi:MAG: cytochrome c [Bryobacterales bacterium]|nr:cytochrome c [Bryobacterales bacterium]